MSKTTRREMLNRSLQVAGAVAVGLPLADASAAPMKEGPSSPGRRLKVLVAGAHPDDPESGCGGTIARYADLGHEVVVIYLTRGEAGISGKSHQEAASIRTAEVQKACQILKARPVFAGQIDGSTEVNPARYAEFRKLIDAERPDVVFTHWPVDTHPDHRATSLLVYDAWLRSGKGFALYCFEVLTGSQTQLFAPNLYVDISGTEGRKRAACYAHVSQQPDEWYPHHDQMNRFRGFEAGTKSAEAFVRHVQDRDIALPLTS
jgi:LmbE family N-acetylglucosaminyl deacetylase